MTTIELNSEYVLDLIDSHPDTTDGTYELVTQEYWGEWRWGVETRTRIIIKDTADRYWAHIYREQSGDPHYNSLEEEGPLAEFEEVEPYEVVETKFRVKE